MRSDHHGIRRRAGIASMLATLIVAASAVLAGPASAQDDARQSAEITEEAFWYAPRGQILPNTLVSEFPPGVICVVQPDACPDGLEPAFGAVEEAERGALAAEEDNQQAQPGPGATNPDTLPVSATGGKADYRSAFRFEIPTVPDGQQVDRFEIQLPKGDPTYSQGSPAFQQAILAAFTCVRGCQEDQFEKIPETDARDGGLLDLEVCPIVAGSEWVPERGQPASALPEVDCLYGSNGVVSEDGSEVAFDLTFAVQALADGSAQFNGFMVRPANLPNLAYGDADTSYNKMFSLEKTLTYTMSTSAAPETSSFDFGADGGSGGLDTSGSTSSGGFTTSPSTASSTGSSGDIFAQPSTADPESAAAPDVAEATPQAAPAADPETTLTAGAAPEPGSAWYVWLLVPVFGAGIYLTAQSLTGAPILAETTGRSGAMTRLLEKRKASADAGPELVSF